MDDKLPHQSSSAEAETQPPPQHTAPSGTSRASQLWLRVVVFVLVVGLTWLLLRMGGRIQQLGRYGYPGIFLVNLLANATLILPVPGVMVTSAFGAVLHPFWVALAAGTGAALGELSGFLAGLSGGRVVLEKIHGHERVEALFARFGEWIILVLALIPNPAFDLAGITAGAMGMPVWRFLLFSWVGKVLKMMVFAYSGATLFEWLGMTG